MTAAHWLYLFVMPGVVMHELSHLLCCRLFKVKVLEVKLWTLNGAPHVTHLWPDSLTACFCIMFAPFFCNSFFALAMGWTLAGHKALPWGILHDPWMALAAYLGLVAGTRSFPSRMDLKNFWDMAERCKSGPAVFLAKIAYIIFMTLIAMRLIRIDFFYSLWLICLPSLRRGLIHWPDLSFLAP